MENIRNRIPQSAFINASRNLPEYFLPDPNTTDIFRHKRGFGEYSDLIIRPELDETKFARTIDTIPDIQRPVPDIVCFPTNEWEYTSPNIHNIMTDFALHGHRVFFIHPDNFLVNNFSPSFGMKTVRSGIFELVLKNSDWAHKKGTVKSNKDPLLGSLAEMREYFRIDECIIYLYQPTWGNLAKKAADKWGWKIIFDKSEQRKSDHDDPNVFSSAKDLNIYANIVLIADHKEVNDVKDEQVVALREQNLDVSQKSSYDYIYEKFMNTVPKASIIIVTYNNYLYTKLCLESIIRSTEYPNYEIIIVDNHSTDETGEKLKLWEAAYPNIRIILNDENFGFAKGNNQGLEQANGDYLILLNTDTVVPPGWMSRLLRHLQDPQVSLVGPISNNVGNRARIKVDYSTVSEMQVFAKKRHFQYDNHVSPIHMLGMFCVALRREVYKQIGPLDEQFKIGTFEDDDYCLRIRNEGLAIFCALDVLVHHFESVTFKNLDDREYIYKENKNKFENKWNTKWYYYESEVLLPYHHFEVDSTSTNKEEKSLYINKIHKQFEHINLINGILAKRDAQLAERDAQLAERDASITELKRNITLLENRINEQSESISTLNARLNLIWGSFSWKITRPLRFIKRFIKSPKHAVLDLQTKLCGNPQTESEIITQIKDSAGKVIHSFVEVINNRSLNGVFILTSAFEFDEFYNQRVINLAKFLASHAWGVMYIACVWHDENKAPPREVKDNIFQIPVNFFLEGYLELQNLEAKDKYFVVEFPHPDFLRIALHLRKHTIKFIYEIIDEWEAFHEVGQAIWYDKDFEEAIIINANYITAVSKPLIEKFSYLRKDIHLIPNGFDPDFLGKIEITNQKGVNESKIDLGYFGHLTPSWFDWDFLKEILDNAKRKNLELFIHLIGYGEPDLEKTLEKYMDNVIFHGKIPPGDLHKFVKDWDCAMIPFKSGKLSEAVDPIKIYEYLYFGLPVLVKGIDHLKVLPNVFVVNGAEEFIDLLLNLKANQNFNMQAIALNKFTWESRFRMLLKVLESETWMFL